MVIVAVLLAILPPLVLRDGSFTTWLYRALTFLVVSCPCALVISIPLGFFGGIGGSSRIGVLVKGSNYLEQLSKTEIVVFDKTGTLTEGIFKVQNVNNINIDKDELLKYAAHAEHVSNHPIANSIKEEYNKEIDEKAINGVKELAGRGIEAKVFEKKVYIGNEKLMQEKNIQYIPASEVGTIVYVAIGDKYAGHIVVADKVKEDAKKTISTLKENSIKKTVMLTGDKKEIGENVANELKLDEVHTELLPDEKVSKVETLINNKNKKGNLVFVGDGINDAPVLAISDVGVAMGGLGSDAAIEAADIVIMTDEPSKLVDAIKISKKTMRIVKENIIFSLVVKFAVLILAAMGISTMWAAVFADVGVSFLAILNSLRMLRVKSK